MKTGVIKVCAIINENLFFLRETFDLFSFLKEIKIKQDLRVNFLVNIHKLSFVFLHQWEEEVLEIYLPWIISSYCNTYI